MFLGETGCVLEALSILAIIFSGFVGKRLAGFPPLFLLNSAVWLNRFAGIS